MSNFRRLIAVFVFGFSCSVFADTYPAVSYYYGTWYGTEIYGASTLSGACSSALGVKDTLGYSTAVSANVHPALTNSCQFKNSGGTVIANFGVNVSNTCPGGGTVSGSNCINAPACQATYTRDVSGACQPPARVCDSSQYDTGTECILIPNCNADSLTGGNFFNTTTKSCQSVSIPTICISDVNTKYCPPIDDCKPSTYICSDNASIVGAAASSRAAEIAAIKAKADAAKSEIVTIKLQSETEAAAKVAAAAAAKTAKDNAKAASDAANAAGVPAAITAAIEAYNKFAQDYIDSLSRSDNAKAAAAKVADIDNQSGQKVTAIPSSNPGNADALNKQNDELLNQAIKALDDAVTGDGSGTGPGSGSPTSSTPSIDTSKLGKDATLKEISSKLNGGAVGSFGAGPDSFYISGYPDGITGVWNAHKSAIMQTSFVSAVSGLTPQVADTGSCPSWSMPMLNGGTMDLQPPCMLWPLLRIIFIVTALFTARSLIFGG